MAIGLVYLGNYNVIIVINEFGLLRKKIIRKALNFVEINTDKICFLDLV